MSDFTLTATGSTAMLSGLLVRADTGAPPSTIAIYGTVQPAAGAAPGGDPLVTIVLTDPCGTISGGVLSLTQADNTGDLIANSGVAVWGRWFSGDGAALADGAVTDTAGAGPFKLGGTTGNNLYAGGRAVLGAVALT